MPGRREYRPAASSLHEAAIGRVWTSIWMPLRAGKISPVRQAEAGLVSRRIFHDERSTGRSWTASSSGPGYIWRTKARFPDSGDFVHVYMGEEAVILCRDRDGQLYGLVNSCRHRGNRVCRVDRGNAGASSVRITAGHTTPERNLIGVPGKTELYKDDIDQPSLGLVRVARIDSYKGLVFGTFDPEAPSLEFLGDMRWAGPAAGPGRSGRGAGRGALEYRGQLEVRRRQRDRRYVPRRLDSSLGHAGGASGRHGASRWRSMRRRASRRASPCWRPMGTGSTPTSPRPMRWTWARRWRPGGSIPPSRRGSGRCVPGAALEHERVPESLRQQRVARSDGPASKGPGRMEVRKTVLVDRNASEDAAHADPFLQPAFRPAGCSSRMTGKLGPEHARRAQPAARDRDLHYAMKLGRARLTRLGDSPPDRGSGQRARAAVAVSLLGRIHGCGVLASCAPPTPNPRITFDARRPERGLRRAAGLMAGIQALLLQHEVEQFYHREAALLDERRFGTGSNCWPMT